MIRLIGVALFTCAGMTALLAAEDGNQKKLAKENKAAEKKADPVLPPEEMKAEEKKAPDKKAEAKAEEKGDAGDDGDKVKEILNRLDNNFGDATERLDKKDAGKETLKVQEDILRDLDELLKQKNKSDCNGGGGGGGGSSNSGGAGSKGGQSGKSGQQSQAKNGGQGQNSKSSSSPQKKSGQEQAKGEEKSKKEEKGQAKGETKKDDKLAKKSGDGGAESKGQKKENNTVADLHKEVWGHLPKAKRQEMDTFSKDRFMPRYEDLLRQYYRTIAESRRKDGD